jgi:type IV pilus biogenesis protein CpaD/CtpE
MRARLATLLLVAAPVGLAACGQSDEDKVRDVLDQVNSSDPAVCSKLSDPLLKGQFNGDKKRCEAQAKRVTQKSLFTVEKVKVDGDDATATVKAKQGGRSRVVFKKEDGDWKVQTIRPG